MIGIGVNSGIVVAVTANATTGSMTTTSGSALVAFLWDDGTPSTAISDSKGNTWVQAANSPTSSTSNAWGARVYVATNITGGSGHTVTVNPCISNVAALVVVEVTGCALSNVIDVSNSISNDANANPACAVTTTLTNDLILAAMFDDRALDTVSDSYTDIVNGAASVFGDIVVCYAAASTIGSYDPAWSGVTGGRSNMAWTGAFKNLSSASVNLMGQICT